MSRRILFASWGWPEHQESDTQTRKEYDTAIKNGTLIVRKKTRKSTITLTEYKPPGKQYSRYILTEKHRDYYTISEYENQWAALDAYKERTQCPTTIPTTTTGAKQTT